MARRTTTISGPLSPPKLSVRLITDEGRRTIHIDADADLIAVNGATITWKFDEKGDMTVHTTRYRVLRTFIPNVDSFNEQNLGKDYVSHIYSPNSRVVRSTDDLTAVKLKSGRKGWLYKGRFIDALELRELLHNVDQTTPAAVSGVSILDAYDSLSARGQALIADMMKDFDWTRFWEEIGSNDPDKDFGEAMDAYNRLVDTIGVLLRW